MRELQEIQVLRCGTCGRGFEDESMLRAHQEQPDPALDGDTHDGEPWSTETVRVGGEYVWEPNTKARSNVRVTRIVDNGDVVDRYWVFADGDNPPGNYPNSLGRFAEAVWPGETWTESS